MIIYFYDIQVPLVVFKPYLRAETAMHIAHWHIHYFEASCCLPKQYSGLSGPRKQVGLGLELALGILRLFSRGLGLQGLGLAYSRSPDYCLGKPGTLQYILTDQPITFEVIVCHVW
jgi:hypothetical protein